MIEPSSVNSMPSGYLTNSVEQEVSKKLKWTIDTPTTFNENCLSRRRAFKDNNSQIKTIIVSQWFTSPNFKNVFLKTQLAR